jgi:HlyD family secretion protein
MDVPRENVTRRRWIRRMGYSGVAIVVVVATTLGLSRLQPAAPSLDRSTLMFGTVKRGLMLRQVRGPGKLVPEEILWITVGTEGRVEKLPLLPGVLVKPDTVLVELSNPELVQSALEAAGKARSAEAKLRSENARLQNELLTMEAGTAKLKADHNEAILQREVDEQLSRDELISERNLKLSRTKVDELKKLIDIDERRAKIFAESIEAQLATQESEVEQYKALAKLKQTQVDALKVRAGVEGVLEQLKVEQGQHVTSGISLAKVTNPRRLKAQLRVPESQARDVLIGQKAFIDTRNSVVPGHVVRVDPASDAGSVAVDVALDAALPREARPDLGVDGTVELERIEDTLYVSRPLYGQGDSTVTLFKIQPGTGYATRVPARFGRTSVNTIEVVEGLSVGDEIILSDTKEWDAFDRLRVR